MATWLKKLELGQYTEVFHMAGYESKADIENLKRLGEKQLRELGINKRGISMLIIILVNQIDGCSVSTPQLTCRGYRELYIILKGHQHVSNNCYNNKYSQT